MMVVGDYEYNKNNKLGQGSFGKVYKGHKKKAPGEDFEVVVAIKEVEVESPKLNYFPHSIKRETGIMEAPGEDFEVVVAIKEVEVESPKLNYFPHSIKRETGIMETLSNPTHTNIVTLLYCENKVDHVYFVMEYCNGGNFQEYLKRKQKLNEHTLRIFLRQIAAGLRAAHEMHVVHRDLKPENICLCFYGDKYPDPGSITFKIADFGIGRFLHGDERANTNCGTLLYMAPEMLFGRTHDYKVDLWSVGVIAYECLVGSQPNDTRLALNGVQLPENISADVAGLLSGLLEKDENKRFDIKQFFNHQFLAETISVRVANDNDHTKLIQVKDNVSVDVLISSVSSAFGLASEPGSLYLIYEGRQLEYGSGCSIKDSGIFHDSTIVFCQRLSGGI